MRSWKALAAVSCLGVASLVLPSVAQADQWNKKTIITVNETIQVPGKVLEPGKYVMKLADSQSNRHIVQIFNEREDQLQTTVLAIPNYRMQPTGDTEFQWWETPAGQPKALRAWFYPGDNFGQEFAYPKREAVQIAASVTQNVPTTHAETEAELATARVGAVDPEGTELELARETYSRAEGIQPSEPPVEIAQQQPAPAPETPIATPAPTPVPEPEVLPRTASDLPLIGLAGMLALGAGMVVRTLSSRS